ncbi:MAG: hypothetical protein ACE5I3_08165 [Phycisphaerae bacterium]
MSNDERPPKPHPDCVWDEDHGVWRFLDDRDELQRRADELTGELGESDQWEQHGFRRRHRARVDRR